MINPYLELLRKGNSVVIRQWNLQILATEILSVTDDLPPKIIKSF